MKSNPRTKYPNNLVNKKAFSDPNSISAKILCNIFILCYLDRLYPWTIAWTCRKHILWGSFLSFIFWHIFLFCATRFFPLTLLYQTILIEQDYFHEQLMCNGGIVFENQDADDSITTFTLHTFISKWSKSQTN